MIELHKGLPELPDRIKRLPLDHRGFPVPWFVAWIDGVAVFRVIGPGKIAEAHNKKKCWICGEPLGVYLAFVIGPMCAINRVISEPPSHYRCARFAAEACPFLTKPKMQRNDRTPLPNEARDAAGVMLKRNPGVPCLWVTRSYRVMRVDNGSLFSIGEPESIEWFAEGRGATPAEVGESVRTGFPLLSQPAIDHGPESVKELWKYVERARPLFPAGAIDFLKGDSQ